MRRSLPLLAILSSGIFASVTAVAEMPFGFNGKSGAALRNAIHECYGPTSVVNPRDMSLTVFDPFNSRTLDITPGVLPAGYEWGALVPPEWWGNDRETAQAVMTDLYNAFPLTGDVRRYRGELTPGVVTDVTYSNPYWKAGRGEISGVVTNLYEPPESFKGELARVYFYMAVMYHRPSWSPRGFMMMTAEAYPGLNGYAVRLLTAWHRDFPVSAGEKERTDAIEKLQGNRNPFVDYPELADYLWGDKAGEPVVILGAPVPLRAVYKMSDERIDLYSPHVPDDALWSIDGVRAQSSDYKPSELGVGKHELGFTSVSTGRKGYVMIKILAE